MSADEATSRSMEEIRSDAVQRVLDKLAARDLLQEFVSGYAHSREIDNHGRHDFGTDIAALVTLARSTASAIEDDIYADLSQIAFLIARDVIGEMLRGDEEIGDNGGPIHWVTSNRYMPPLRDLDDVESIWQVEDKEDQYAATLMEAIHAECQKIDILLATPEYDNSVYAVDLRVWCPTDNEDADDLDDEWERIEKPAS